MRVHRTSTAMLAAFIAVSLASGYSTARAGNLWVDSPYESVAVPLESPSLGIARAQQYLELRRLDRAELALKKVIAKYPTSTEAHRLLAKLYEDTGKADLALAHQKLAAALL